MALLSRFFAEGDREELCVNDDGVAQIGAMSCKDSLFLKTVNSLGKIKAILSQMKDATSAAQFTALHARMGKEVVKNQFVLGAFFALDEKRELGFKLKLEGQRVSRVLTTVPANPACR